MTSNINRAWLALGVCLCACAPETPISGMTTPAPSAAITQPSAPATPPVVSMQAKPATAAPIAAPAAPPAAPIMTAAPAAPPAAPAMGPAGAPAAPPAVPPPAPGNKEAPPAGAPMAPPPAAGLPGAPPAGAGGGAGAEAFCAKYEKNCKYGAAQRHADKNACMADFNAAPIQQGCKNMHMDTAIAGTAAACNGMPSEFCFAIHCLHAAGIVDQTGVTYCK